MAGLGLTHQQPHKQAISQMHCIWAWASGSRRPAKALPSSAEIQAANSALVQMCEACHACRLLGQLSQMQQQLVQPSRGASSRGLAAEVDRLSICFVIATVQVEAAAQLLQVRPCSCLCSHGDSVF